MNRNLAATLALGLFLAPAAAHANLFTLPFRAATAAGKAVVSVGNAALGAARRGDPVAAIGHLNPVNGFLVGYQKLTAPHADPKDPATWAPSFHYGKARQRGMVDEHGRIYMRTEATVDAPIAHAAPRAEAALRGPWTEFGYGGNYIPLDHGEYTRRTGRPAERDSVTYELQPPAGLRFAPGGAVRVKEKMLTSLDSTGLHTSIQLDGDMNGAASIDVLPRGTKSKAVFAFHGPFSDGLFLKAMGPSTAAALHGLVEIQGADALSEKLGKR